MRATIRRRLGGLWPHGPGVRATVTIAAVLTVLLLLPVLIDDTYRRTLAATFVGAALGFFVALYIDRIQRREDEATRRSADEALARIRKVAVLSSLRRELGLVAKGMDARQGRSGNEPSKPPLPDQMWRAMCASGEIRWIADINIELLDLIATAYRLIAEEVELERGWRQDMAAQAGSHAVYFKRELLGIDHETWVLTRDAARDIDRALTALGVDPLTVAGPLFAP